MSHTNSTSHYSLPQFVGTDIPTWLGDFNSAMTAIDSGINAAATSASGAATTAEQALEAANRCPFPIGYGGFFQTDPTTIYSGTTWAQKKDVFILAAGDTFAAESTGGEAQHKLTVDEMPTHKHSSGSYQNGYSSNNSDEGAYCTWVNIGTAHNNDPGPTTGENGPVSTSWVGGSQPHNNMPPYYTMPFWIRTA